VFVTQRLRASGMPVVVGRHDDGAWVKALAVDDALAQTDASVLVVHDADVLADGLMAAVEAVEGGAPWAVPHRGVHRLTADSTRHFTHGVRLEHLLLDERAYLGVEGGGVVVLRRDVYEACPLDRRFVGWGSEDESWGFALRTLFGPPVRVASPLVHFWHPPQPRVTRSYGSGASLLLRKSYARAHGQPDVMRSLIEEGRSCSAMSTTS
jgi:hypothetical protein